MTRKQHILTWLLYCGAAATLNSCIDYDDATKETTAHIQLAMPAEFVNGSDLQGHEIVLVQGSTRLTGTTDANGVATFTDLIPDVYDISCSWEINGEQYQQLTGDQQIVSGCTVSGSLNAHLIREEQTIQLSTNLSINRDIIIGKVFFAGSKDNNNRTYMPGKYVELYNQSNDTVDISGLYIGLIESESTQAYTLQNLHDQYADSVVLAKQVFRIPADQPFTVKPGGTVLLANSATDHTDGNDMENDLSDADFEAKDVSGRTQNNPAVPALELTYTMYPSISNMNLVQNGLCSVVIFRTDQDVAALPTTYAYGKTTGNQWLLLPIRYIVDGVEILPNKATGVDVSTKRLYPTIDAGYTNIEGRSGWTGEVVYRRTGDKRANDGHLILIDTNNSSNDFHVSTTIKPRQYDE
ncbi:MAG: DUF4876 domain-containing protein [Prevotella sp.]|nr:DUF4876 domain-containing protein [Prevotella sp.]